MIEIYEGTIGSGKSYHALEDIVDALDRGKYVIANFPIKFTKNMIRKGQHERFMFVPDEELERSGVPLLLKIAFKYDFLGKEGSCLVVIDEGGNHFPKADAQKPKQRLWAKFFSMSRKLGYDFKIVCQDSTAQINITIRKCAEYTIKHRLANHVFPFSLLPVKLFFYVRYWTQQNIRLSTSSSLLVKRFANLYDSWMIFSDLVDEELMQEADSYIEKGNIKFGNVAQ